MRVTNSLPAIAATTVAVALTVAGCGTGAAASMPDMDQNGGGPGMSSAAGFPDLDGLSGTAFDQEWLTLMTDRHQGAITMATTELSKGTNPDAKHLATNIISAQTTEIQHMRTLIHS